MIRVAVELTENGTACRRLIVQAQSLLGALSLVEEHCVGDCTARVVFPIEPEAFFVREPGATVGLVGVEPVEKSPPAGERSGETAGS
ncbi:MAG: hypothetical protein AB1425_09405 [Actinomycetota bacterium]